MTDNFYITYTSQPMRFQQRDESILKTIQSYDGILARRQIKEMFWEDASNQAMERRLSLLFHNHYLNWPNVEQRRTRPIPEPIVWLGWRGILHLAQQQTHFDAAEPKAMLRIKCVCWKADSGRRGFTGSENHIGASSLMTLRLMISGCRLKSGE